MSFGGNIANGGFDIIKSAVKQSLIFSMPVYNDFVKNILQANKTMIKLRSYWGGDLYNEIVEEWNSLCPALNLFLDNSGSAYNFMSDAIKVYTSTEHETINQGNVDITKATRLEPNDSDDLKSTPAEMYKDRKEIADCLITANGLVDELFRRLVDSEASSQAINEAKDLMDANKKKIHDGLLKVSSLVSQNITTAATDYESHEKTVRGGLA